MTVFRLTFAGQIKKAEHRQVGDKNVLTLSVCKKNYAKDGQEPTFTWINVNVWGPLPDWLVSKAVKGALIAGTGEFSMRSYQDKNGAKCVSAEARCQSYDVVVGTDEALEAAAPQKSQAKAPSKPAAAVAEDDDSQPPF